MRAIHHLRRQRFRACHSSELVFSFVPRRRPQVLDRVSDLFTRYGDEEKAALKHFDFLDEYIVSPSDGPSPQEKSPQHHYSSSAPQQDFGLSYSLINSFNSTQDSADSSDASLGAAAAAAKHAATDISLDCDTNIRDSPSNSSTLSKSLENPKCLSSPTASNRHVIFWDCDACAESEDDYHDDLTPSEVIQTAGETGLQDKSYPSSFRQDLSDSLLQHSSRSNNSQFQMDDIAERTDHGGSGAAPSQPRLSYSTLHPTATD